MTIQCCTNLLGILSYVRSVGCRNSSATLVAVSPVEVVEGILLVVLHSILQNQLRELSPVCNELNAVAEVELLLLCRIGLYVQVSLGVGDVQQDVTIEHHVASLGLNQYANQRLTVNSSRATNIDSLLDFVDAQSAQTTVVAGLSLLGSIQISIGEGCITRVASNVTRYLVVNQLELVVHVIVLFLTVRLAIGSLELVSRPLHSRNLTGNNVLLQDLDTQILLQVDVVIVNSELECSTQVVVESLLGRVPNENLVTSAVPAVLVTSLRSGRTESRLRIHRSVVPNQTLQAEARRNQQSIVRGNVAVIHVVQLQSDGVVLIGVSSAILLVPAVPCRMSSGQRVACIQRSGSGQIATIDDIVGGIGLQILRILNLQTSLQILNRRVLSSSRSLNLEYVLVLIEQTEGLRRGNLQLRSSCTSVGINHLRSQHLISRQVSVVRQACVSRINLIVYTNNRAIDNLLTSRNLSLRQVRQEVGQIVIHGTIVSNGLAMMLHTSTTSRLLIGSRSILLHERLVSKPRILDGLDTVQVEVRNEYQALQRTIQRNGNSSNIAVRILQATQSQRLVSRVPNCVNRRST